MGVSVLDPKTGHFEFRPGAIFANVVLADEINRTTPRTQSALLEAMNDQQVSVDGRSHRLEPPFLVIATQNPEEHYGTYPLPESQMDRFILRLRLDYPLPEDEKRLLLETSGAPGEALAKLQPVLPLRDIVALAGGGRPGEAVARAGGVHRGGGAGDPALARSSAWASRRAGSWPGATWPGRRRWPTGATSCCPTTSSRWPARRWPTAWCWPTRSTPPAARARRRSACSPRSSPACPCPARAPAALVLRSLPMPRLRLPRRFPPTREGWWFLLATLLVGAAAVNGGINLLFLVFGMMIFLILASGVLSELCLRGLEVTRRPPSAIHAGTPYLMGIAVRNGKRRLPTFSLEVEDLVAGQPGRPPLLLPEAAGRTRAGDRLPQRARPAAATTS